MGVFRGLAFAGATTNGANGQIATNLQVHLRHKYEAAPKFCRVPSCRDCGRLKARLSIFCESRDFDRSFHSLTTSVLP